eukprot:1040059-Pelagomonas_calceolata.AAC.10
MSTDPDVLFPRREGGEGQSRKRSQVPPELIEDASTRTPKHETPSTPFSFSSGSAAKAHRKDSPESSPRQHAPAHGQIFRGCHFFSFIPTHMQTQFQKIRERKGTIDKALSATSEKLVLGSGVGGVTQGSVGGWVERGGRGCLPRLNCPLHRPDMPLRRLQEKLQAHGITPPQPSPQGSSPGATLPGLPFHFVTQDFVGRSILSGKREDEALHTPLAVKEFQQQCRTLMLQSSPSAPLTPPEIAKRPPNRGGEEEAASLSPQGVQPSPHRPLAVAAVASSTPSASPASPPATPSPSRQSKGNTPSHAGTLKLHSQDSFNSCGAVLLCIVLRGKEDLRKLSLTWTP